MNALVVINPEMGGGKGTVIGERVRCSTNDPVLLTCVGGDGLVHDLPKTRGPERINLVLVSHNQVETPFVQIIGTGFVSVVNAQANNYKIRIADQALQVFRL